MEVAALYWSVRRAWAWVSALGPHHQRPVVTERETVKQKAGELAEFVPLAVDNLLVVPAIVHMYNCHVGLQSCLKGH